MSVKDVMNKKSTFHIDSLDGLRAVAALMVMFFHFFQHVSTSHSFVLFIKKISGFGQTGVSLFFVLSGFLITRILLKEKQSEKYFLNFYVRRSLRIFPLYYFYLLLVFFIIPFFENASIPALSQQIYHWVYLQDFAITFKWNYLGPIHFWSLAVEEHFYLFFPLLVYFLKEKQLVLSLCVLIIVSITLRFMLSSNGYEVFYFTFTRLDELCLGAFLAFLELKGKFTEGSAKRFLYVLGLMLAPIFLLWYFFTSESNVFVQTFKYLLISIIYFCVIGFIITATKTNFLNKILATKPLLFTGKISYGLYVYHGLCFAYFAKYFHTDYILLNFFASFIFSFIVATISFYAFEKHFLKLKKYFIYVKT